MQSNAQAIETLGPEPVEARVVAVDGPRSVQVELHGVPFPATVATTGAYAPAVGDRVVVLPGRRASWIVGVIGALRATPATSDGVGASVEHDVLTVTSPRGEVLFTHDARTGTSTVRGREVRVAADAVAFEGRTVSIAGADEVRIAGGDDRLTIGGARSTLEAKRFRAELEEARFSIRDAFLGVGRVEAAVGRAKQTFEVLDLTAERIVERTKDVFRETEGVAQTRAGRIRMVAAGVFSLLSERATIKAEDDVAIVGEKIELG